MAMQPIELRRDRLTAVLDSIKETELASVAVEKGTPLANDNLRLLNALRELALALHDEKSQLKLQLMSRFHPGVPIRVVGQTEYKRLQAEFSPRIPCWEFYTSRYIAKRKAA